MQHRFSTAFFFFVDRDQLRIIIAWGEANKAVVA